jgi:hypothetical protein
MPGWIGVGVAMPFPRVVVVVAKVVAVVLVHALAPGIATQ